MRLELGDRVYCDYWGHGEVSGFTTDHTHDDPVIITFDTGRKERYRLDGKWTEGNPRQLTVTVPADRQVEFVGEYVKIIEKSGAYTLLKRGQGFYRIVNNQVNDISVGAKIEEVVNFLIGGSTECLDQ